MFSSNLFVMGLIAIGVIFIVCFFSYVRVPVNKIAFISGIGKNRVAKGKLVIYLRFFERVDYLDLSVFSVDVNTAVAVPTNDFINIKVDAVVNLQVDETAGILEIAAKNFLNRKSSDIAISVKDVLEGNLREIVGQMQLKEIVQNRKNFNEKVQENVAPDLREMGLKVISFNVQNFQEDKQVIENLGAENISKISKEASIARAEADKEIEIAKANANKEAMDIKLKTEQDIAEKENALAIKKAELKVKADTEKAKADVTYELEKERKRKEIEEVTGLSNLVREQKAIETNKAKYEAETIVPKQADAEARKVEKTKEAEAKKIEEQQAAEAKLYKEQREAEAIKLRALAEAEGVREKGLAEAEALDKKAEAMAKYGDAAKLEMYYNALPLVAKNLAEPLSKIGNITMYGEGNTTKFMSEMTQNLDKVLKAATDGLGIDAKALLTSYLGGKIAQNKNQSSKDEVIETEEK